MVLTDLPFHHTSAVHTRYLYVQRPGSALKDDEIDEEEKYELSQEYAAFLRDQEQKAGKVEQVQVNGVTLTYQGKPRSEPVRRLTELPKPPSALDVAHKTEKEKQAYEKRIKAIEDHMWQHKLDEKDFKKAEGDLLKGQHDVRKNMRDFEQAILRKKMSEEKKLSEGLSRYAKLHQDHLHKKNEETRNHIGELQQSSKDAKEANRKAMIKANELAHQYKSKMFEMEVKRIEMMRISQAFEAQLRTKEEEQFRLKKELAELSISLNMEAAKTRKQKDEASRKAKDERKKRLEAQQEAAQKMEQRMLRGETKEARIAELNRRKLSADLSLTKAHLVAKQRDDGRQLLEARNNLQSNNFAQRSLNQASQQAKMDLQAKEIEQKLQAVESRKSQQAQQAQRARRESSSEHEALYQDKFKRRFMDQQRKEHEDHLEHFQKTVNKGEAQEQMLFQQVRESDMARQKREEQVRKMQRQLAEAKRRHQLEIKQQMIHVNKVERDLGAKLQRQQAALSKVHTEREEKYQSLVKHRASLREYQHHLKEHQREHGRLVRVHEKSETLRSTSS